jgi:hypothetical protein
MFHILRRHLSMTLEQLRCMGILAVVGLNLPEWCCCDKINSFKTFGVCVKPFRQILSAVSIILFLLTCTAHAANTLSDGSVRELPPVNDGTKDWSILKVVPPTQPAKEKVFDWNEANPPRNDPEFVVDIPFVVNGTVPIQTYTEQHYTLMRQLKDVENAMLHYYDLREQGVPSEKLGAWKREVYILVGRVVTTMDGYARIYHEDISPYMKLLQETLRQFWDGWTPPTVNMLPKSGDLAK